MTVLPSGVSTEAMAEAMILIGIGVLAFVAYTTAQIVRRLRNDRY